MEYSLKYGKSELPLGAGALTIGRGAGCQVTLDDALVSRQHARVTIEGETVSVEDLGSRNGVMVNGKRIDARTALSPGDRLVVGSVEFELRAQPSGRGGQVGSSTIADDYRTLDGERSPVVDLAEEDESTVHTRQPEAFDLLGSVVERAIRAGHHDEAERLLHGHVWSLLTDAKRGNKIPPATKAAAARHAVTVAEGSGKGIWVDYVFELYRAGPDVLPLSVINDLSRVIPKLARVDAGAIREYVRELNRAATSFGPAERVLFSKIAELERAAVMAATRE